MVSPKSALLTAVRVVLVAVGVGIAAATAFQLATMPPPPPDSDGFVHGMAVIVGSVIILVSLGVAAVSVVLPAVLGRADPLGFSRPQRLALKAAGALIGVGLLLGAAYGFVTMLPLGVVVLFGFVALAAAVVGATLVWRLAEVLVRRLSSPDEGVS